MSRCFYLGLLLLAASQAVWALWLCGCIEIWNRDLIATLFLASLGAAGIATVGWINSRYP